jgi:ribulose-5-phosphate 4-epimerase/fuculose-1-phosphate aldolase
VTAGTDNNRGMTTVQRPLPGPGIGVELTLQQELACALRILAGSGFGENIAGHITWADATTPNLWANPWGKWWEEVQASDIVAVDPDGHVVDGRWDVTPAVFLHTELHRARPDARIVIHNHPYFATLLAAMGEAPRLVHQNSCIFDGELGVVDEYDGSIDDASSGARLAERVGSASGVLLVSHGVIVTGPTIQEATYKAVTFERMCRMTYDVLRAGREPVEIPEPARASMKALLKRNAPRVYWEGAVRQLLRDQPEVLS